MAEPAVRATNAYHASGSSSGVDRGMVPLLLGRALTVITLAMQPQAMGTADATPSS
jgi:hypothetical protein